MGKYNKKNLYNLVKISNRLSGRTFTTGVLMKLMGYSTKSKFYTTNAAYFVKSCLNPKSNYKYPVYQFGFWILTPNFPKVLIDETHHQDVKRVLHDGDRKSVV